MVMYYKKKLKTYVKQDRVKISPAAWNRNKLSILFPLLCCLLFTKWLTEMTDVLLSPAASCRTIWSPKLKV